MAKAISDFRALATVSDSDASIAAALNQACEMAATGDYQVFIDLAISVFGSDSYVGEALLSAAVVNLCPQYTTGLRAWAAS